MTCRKCKGLMVQERPSGSFNTIILRCLNCGLLIDPLIEKTCGNHAPSKNRLEEERRY